MTKKIFSSSWKQVKTWRSLLVYNGDYSSPAILSLIHHPDKYLNIATKYFKNKEGDTSTVGLVTIEDKLLIVKRYNVKNFWHGLKLWLRPSRAMTSLKNIMLLKAIHVPTINPIAVIEKRFGPLRREAYFIYDYVDGDIFFDYLEKNQQMTPSLKVALHSMAKTLKAFQENYIYHGDCHHKNMVLYNNEVLLLDLDHMKQYRFFKWRFKKKHQREIEKFLLYFDSNEQAKSYFLELIK